jgi:hypothetical protein
VVRLARLCGNIATHSGWPSAFRRRRGHTHSAAPALTVAIAYRLPPLPKKTVVQKSVPC